MSWAARQMRGVKVMLRRIPLQKREEGLWYFSRSSFSGPEDSKASIKDLSLGSNRKDLSNGSLEKKTREIGPTRSWQGPGDRLMEYIRVEEESQIIEQKEGKTGGAEPPTNINGSEKDVPRWRTPEEKGTVG